MGEVQVINWLVNQAGPAGLAGLAIWLLNRVWSQMVDRERQHYESRCKELEADAATQRDDKDRMIRVVEANTAAMTELRQVVQHLSDQWSSK